ncbi:hypothetical protein BJF84_15685 [Rhodococcus sp. CUA-806]|jgi:threonine/homoserine/homoserine lactone efflux protein|nr:hypothetical protein BJF84_15685 [Rhodococcus sp. CUA-806]
MELGSLPLAAAVAVGGRRDYLKRLGERVHYCELVGAAYLGYLGVQAIRHRREGFDTADSPGEPTELGAWTCVRRGFVVGVSNPKQLCPSLRC